MEAWAVKAEVSLEVILMYDFKVKNLSFLTLWALLLTSGLSVLFGILSSRSHRHIWTFAFWMAMLFLVLTASFSIYLWTSSWWIATGPLLPAIIFGLIYLTLKRSKP